MTGVRFPVGAMMGFATASRPALGFTQPPNKLVPGTLTPWGKYAGEWRWPLYLVQRFTASPYVFMAQCLVQHRHNFTFTDWKKGRGSTMSHNACNYILYLFTSAPRCVPGINVGVLLTSCTGVTCLSHFKSQLMVQGSNPSPCTFHYKYKTLPSRASQLSQYND
jgi:hypothetical protein